MRKSHIKRRGKKSLVGGMSSSSGILNVGISKMIPTFKISESIQRLSKSIPMPSYFSRSDLNKQYTQLQLGKHIAEIKNYNREILWICTELKKLQERKLEDYNSLANEKNKAWDQQNNATWRKYAKHKEDIGNGYKSYSDNMNDIIIEVIINYRKCNLLICNLKIREIDLQLSKLASPDPKLVSLRAEINRTIERIGKVDVIKPGKGTDIKPIDKDEEALLEYINDLEETCENYMNSGYTDSTYEYYKTTGELMPQHVRTMHISKENVGRNLINELYNRREALDKKATEFCKSIDSILKVTVSSYEAMDRVWKEAMKLQNPIDAERVFNEGMTKLEQNKGAEERAMEQLAHAAVAAGDVATTGHVATAGDEAVARAAAAAAGAEAVEGVAAAGAEAVEGVAAVGAEAVEGGKTKINDTNM